jgi:hypothetical protein
MLSGGVFRLESRYLNALNKIDQLILVGSSPADSSACISLVRAVRVPQAMRLEAGVRNRLCLELRVEMSKPSHFTAPQGLLFKHVRQY